MASSKKQNVFCFIFVWIYSQVILIGWRSFNMAIEMRSLVCLFVLVTLSWGLPSGPRSLHSFLPSSSQHDSLLIQGQWENFLLHAKVDLYNRMKLWKWYSITLAIVYFLELLCCAQAHSCVRLFVTPWTAVRQVPLSLGFFRQEYWNCHALLQGILPTRGTKPGLPHYGQILYHLNHQGNPIYQQ